MRIGKKKNIVYAFVEADVTYPLKIINNLKKSGARRLIWRYLLKHPKAWKLFLGTAGVTSVGMFGEGPITVLPITPMTATLAIGTVFAKPKIEGDRVVGTEYALTLTLAVDHNIIDGGLLMRFIGSLKEEIKSCRNIDFPETKIAEEV